MEIILFIALLAISALAIPFGADSRKLDDQSYDRDSLWSR
jgi:hypothetical protein